MRINEILTESQLQQIEEGPKLDAVGRGVGQAVGGFAKGVGALAGGVRGAFTALKKGYQSGKAIVGDDPDPNAGKPGYTAPVDQTAPAPDPKVAPAPVADPKVAPAPVADPKVAPAPEPAPAPSTTTPPSAAEINAQGPEGSAPAKPQTGDAGKALAKSTAVVDKTQAQSQEKANQTVYAQVKANVDKLDKKGKQRILQLLQKSVAAPQPKSAADPAAAAAKRAGAKAAPGAGAFANMAKTLSQEPTKAAAAPAADPAAAAPAADPAAAAAPAADPAAAAAGAADSAAAPAKVPKKTGGASRVPKKPAPTPTASAQADAGKPGFLQSKIKGSQVTASLVHRGKSLNEVFAQRLSLHKQKMFETGLARGTVSVFRK